MAIRKAIRWIVAIAVTGLATLAAAMGVAALVLRSGGCTAPTGGEEPGLCLLFIQLLPLLSILLWVALSVYFIRAFK